jgi:hypothetical protein
MASDSMGETSAKEGELSTPVETVMGVLKLNSWPCVLIAAGIDRGAVDTDGTDCARVATLRRRVGD